VAVLLFATVSTGVLTWTVASETARLETALRDRERALEERVDGLASGLRQTQSDLTGSLALAEQRVADLTLHLDLLDASMGERIASESQELATEIEAVRAHLETVRSELANADISIRTDFSTQQAALQAVSTELDRLETDTAALEGQIARAGGTDMTSLYNDVKDGVVEVMSGSFVSGSGFVYGTEKRHVVTAWHVVSGIQDSISVRTRGGVVVSASVANKSESEDFAILLLSEPLTDAKALPLADTSALSVGEPVLVVGSPAALRGSASTGIVSGVGRTSEDFPSSFFPGMVGFSPSNLVQVDAAINPGNSGGPVFNVRGEVIGFASFTVIWDGVGGSRGVNFAIAADAFRQLANSAIGG
jgi:S1-C subfamily serine protease